jgi:hypothetical protein
MRKFLRKKKNDAEVKIKQVKSHNLNTKRIGN